MNKIFIFINGTLIIFQINANCDICFVISYIHIIGISVRTQPQNNVISDRRSQSRSRQRDRYSGSQGLSSKWEGVLHLDFKAFFCEKIYKFAMKVIEI